MGGVATNMRDRRFLSRQALQCFLSRQRNLYRDILLKGSCCDRIFPCYDRVCKAPCCDRVSCVTTGPEAGRAEVHATARSVRTTARSERALCLRQTWNNTLCCVLLGHCTWTLFTNTVHRVLFKKKKSTKMTPGNWASQSNKKKIISHHSNIKKKILHQESWCLYFIIYKSHNHKIAL